jgi:hypothetical protein
MICIHDTMTLLHHVNKAAQTNSRLKLYIYHNELICEQYSGFLRSWNRAWLDVYLILYNQRDATYTMLFIIISAQHVSGGFPANH